MAAIGLKKKKKGEEKPAGDAAATEEGGEQAAGKKKKDGDGGGKSKIITVVLIIVLVAAALFAGGVVTTKILLPSIMNDLLKNAENNPGSSEETPIGEEEEAEGLELVATHALDEMTIQLAPDQYGAGSFLVMQMGVGFTDKKAAAVFEEKKLEIQDIVLSTLMAKTKDELSSQNDVEALKKVLASKIAKLFASEFKKNQVKIVISKFLIQ